MDKKANRQRNIQKKFFVSELENQIIESLKEFTSTISQGNLEIKRIGNNLNQIAKYLNESEQNLTKELLNNYQEELQLLDKKLKKMLKEIQGG